MHLKYLHYFGNESNESILEAYGIVTKDKQTSDILKPMQCPNCSEPNKPDSKFCAKCRMVLTYDAYNETIEEKQQKDDDIAELKAAVAFLTSKVNSAILANEPSSKVISDEKGIPKGIKVSAMEGIAIAEIADNS
jgi:UTP-glucose-1-phosphate uridylyltransferase